MSSITVHVDYRLALSEIKQRIQTTQMRAVLAANNELVSLYWYIGQKIVTLQQAQEWGGAVVDEMAKDLQSEHPGIQGFSRTSLFAMRQFYLFLSPRFTIVPQAVGQLPWGHIRTILSKIKDVDVALFYAAACAENGWSRSILCLQIEQGLHLRQGLAPSNFKAVLPSPQSELAQQTLKDPYMFDFLTLSQRAVERDVENQLVANITRFLLELGKGFAFVARQQRISTESQDFYIDLVFYNYLLKCFVLIDLKSGKLTHQDIGQMDMYVRMYDDLKRGESDNPTVGIILCSQKDESVVRYSVLNGSEQLFASRYKLVLPSEEELRKELERERTMLLEQAEAYQADGGDHE